MPYDMTGQYFDHTDYFQFEPCSWCKEYFPVDEMYEYGDDHYCWWCHEELQND